MNIRILIAVLLFQTCLFSASFSHDEEVSFESAQPGKVLFGTLKVPNTAGPHPGIILISGSGPYSRKTDAHLRVLAEKFTSIGVAVLRFDKRGCGKSEGDFLPATTFDLASDVEKAIEFLKVQTVIDSRQVGLFGVSEGSIIAAMNSAWRTDLAFVIFYGAPSMNLIELGDKRRALMIENQVTIGVMTVKIGQAIAAISERLNSQVILNHEINEQESLKLAEEIARDTCANMKLLNNDTEMLTNSLLARYKESESFAWVRYTSKIDQPRYFQMITPTTPVLVVNGDMDFYVPHDLNIPIIRKALSYSKNPDVTIKVLPKIGHFFNECRFYGSDLETKGIDPTLANTFTSWLSQKIRVAPVHP